MDTMLQYKCPNCGGQLEFSSKEQNMVCPYCDSVIDISTLEDYEKEMENAQPTEEPQWKTEGTEWSEEEAQRLNVYVCNSCGGEVVADETTGATHCPYCSNPVILSGKFAGGLKPDYIIPFKVDKKATKEALKNHMKGKILLPKVFKDENHIDEIKGIYVPFWLFDAKAKGDNHFKATKVRHWSDSNYNYTETSHYSVVRGGSVEFEKIPVDASSKMDDALMDSVEPFNLAEAMDFNTAYLSGYFADKYDVEISESIGRANTRIINSTEDAFRSTVSGYSSVIKESASLGFENTVAKYALYPVWVLNTSWNGQKFVFAINGQTGKIVGNLPTDKQKYFAFLGGLAVAYSAVAFVILSMLGLF